MVEYNEIRKINSEKRDTNQRNILFIEIEEDDTIQLDIRGPCI